MSGEAETTATAEPTRDSEKLLEGTPYETTVYRTVASEEGPTVMVIGGMHGSESAGYTAVEQLRSWPIEKGTLVTIPRANAYAVERETRLGRGSVDLNRQFPLNEDPQTRLAKAIWETVSQADPDILLDLHESHGIYDGDATTGVGQAIFHSRDDKAMREAQTAANAVNATRVKNEMYAFETGLFTEPGINPDGLLVHKAAWEMNARSYLVETVQQGPALETRVDWQRTVVKEIVADDLFIQKASAKSDEETNEPPSAVIRTTPANAADADLHQGQTVCLDGSHSSDPNGEIASYEWDLDGDGTFDVTGESTELTLSSCGERTVTLQVTDDNGTTDTSQLTLSTN